MSMTSLLVLVALSLFAVCHASHRMHATKPNVLILFADDLGYGDLGVYGNPTILTPNIDRLAAEGVRFTQWYSAFHVCSPSRAAMMTGRIPIRSGTAGNTWTGGVFTNDAVGGLPTNETTLPQLLKQTGYQTYAVGKWHLGQQTKFLPTSRGFDRYLGLPYSVDMGASAWKPINDFPVPLLEDTTIIEQPANYDVLSARYVSFVDSAIKNSTSNNSPFFIYMAFSHVHVPDFASPQFCNSSKGGRFGDALQELDSTLGNIMQLLKTYGVDDNTIVFFTSDNGPWLTQGLMGGCAGLLRDGKQTTWEGGIREPGIIRWSGKLQPKVSTEVVATYDIFSTVLALAGVAAPSDRYIDGKDLTGLLFNNEPSPHECLFHYKGSPGVDCPAEYPNCPGLWAVRCGAYKLHFATSESLVDPAKGTVQNPPLLYNVEHDPREWYPVNSTSQEYSAVTAYILDKVKEHEKTVVPAPNEMGRGSHPALALCGCPNSQAKYPQYPNCTCNPENFKVFVCPLTPQNLELEAVAEARSKYYN